MMITTRRGRLSNGYISSMGDMIKRLQSCRIKSQQPSKTYWNQCTTFASQNGLRPVCKIGNMSNRTFTMIKPDAFSKGHSGAIIDKIQKSGFVIVALKLTRLTSEKAGEFYAV